MNPRTTWLLIPLLALTCRQAFPARTSEGDPLPAPQFPAVVTDTTGEKIDVAALVKERTVVVVTLKATWCAVCQEQLVRLKQRLPLISEKHVTFLVLAPGPADELEGIRKRTAFPYPFIEDRDLRIAKHLDLELSDEEISPCIFILNAQRKIRWIQSGRSGWYYGDDELMQQIGLDRWI